MEEGIWIGNGRNCVTFFTAAALLCCSLFSTRAPARSLFFPFNLLVAIPSNVFFHCLVDHPPKCRALGGWLAVCAPVLHLCQQTAQPAPLLLHKILHFCPWHRGRGVQALLRPTCALNLFLSPTRPASCFCSSCNRLTNHRPLGNP